MKDHCNSHGGQQLYRDMRSAARAPAFTASNPIIATWTSRAFDSSASIPRRQTLRPPAAASVPTGQPLPSLNAAWSYQGHDSTLRSRPLPAAAPLLSSSSALPRAANPYPAALRFHPLILTDAGCRRQKSQQKGDRPSATCCKAQ
jgi:hypothetical protein